MLDVSEVGSIGTAPWWARGRRSGGGGGRRRPLVLVATPHRADIADALAVAALADDLVPDGDGPLAPASDSAPDVARAMTLAGARATTMQAHLGAAAVRRLLMNEVNVNEP